MAAVVTLLVALAAIVAGAGLARWAMLRLGLPGVVGEILLGVALGPSLLGWLAPSAHASIFPAAGDSALQALAWVGLVLFVFQVGLEMHWRADQVRPMVRLAAGGLVLPLAAGMMLALAFPQWFFAGAAAPFGGLLVVGIVLSVSALPVLARVLEDLNLVGSRLGALVMGAATFDDVVGWVLLALVSLAGPAGTAGLGPQAAAFATGLAAVAAGGVALLAAHRLAGRWLDTAPPSQGRLAGILALVFASAALTEWAGLNAVLGPLGVGAVLARHRALRADLVQRMGHVTRVLLLPVFFVVGGAAVDLRGIAVPEGLAALLVLPVVATVAKVLGCAAGARAAGMTWRDGMAAGSLLSARGAVGLVVAKVGLDSGFLSTAGYSALVLMVALTTLAAPLLARRFLPPAPPPVQVVPSK